MAEQVGKVAKMWMDSSKQSGNCAMVGVAAVESLLMKPLASPSQCERLRQMALSLPASHPPANADVIGEKLDWLASALPRQKTDVEAGKMRTVVYVKLLHGHSREALDYMTEQALRTLDWFPTPRQCLKILEGYCPPLTLREKAIGKCARYTQDMLEEFLAELKAGDVSQERIDAQPERFKRIAEVQMLLRHQGGEYRQ